MTACAKVIHQTTHIHFLHWRAAGFVHMCIMKGPHGASCLSSVTDSVQERLRWLCSPPQKDTVTWRHIVYIHDGCMHQEELLCSIFCYFWYAIWKYKNTQAHTHTCTHISRYHDWHVWWIIVNSPVLLWFCKGMWYSFMWYWHEITAKVIVYVQDLLHYVWQMLSCDERSSFPPLPWITDIEINNGSASLRL